MRYRKERIYDYSLETVVTHFMEREGTAYDLSELENVTGWKVVKEEDLGDKVIGTKEWCAHAQIPKALQQIVSPRMLSWYEHSVWNRKTNVYTFEIEPFYMKKQASCRGATIYADKGNGKSSRTFEIDLQVKIPVLGQIFEVFAIDLLKKNEHKDFDLSVKSLKKEFG